MWRHIELDAQLRAIKLFLHRNQEDEQNLEREIATLFEQGRQLEMATKGSALPYFGEAWLDRVEEAYYLDAVHSTAAASLLAPFLEALFVAVFQNFRSEVEQAVQASPKHDRSQASESKLCDPNYFFGQIGKPERNIVKGINQLADLIKLAKYFPSDYRDTLEALFYYRNKMLHLGFVWPDDERVNFQSKIRDNNWPEGWFDDTSRGDESCILYMSHEFIEHCLETTDGILDGIGAYYRSLHEDELEKFTSILKNLPDVDFFNIARTQEKK